MPSIRLLIIYHTQQESNVVCLTHEGELKFHDVISLILPPSINLAPNLSVNYSALLTPCTTDDVQPKGFGAACSSHATEFFAVRSEDSKNSFKQFEFLLLPSKQVIASVNQFCELISKRELQTMCLFHYVSHWL